MPAASLCALSPELLQLPSAAGTGEERRGVLVGCSVLLGYFSCFAGSSSEAGVCLDFSITARLEAATPMIALLTITSQPLLVSLCIRAGCFCAIAERQASCSRGDASPPSPWEGQIGDRTPFSGLLALLAQPALCVMSQGTSHHGLGCIQPHHIPFILYSSYVVGVSNMLSLTALTQPLSSWGLL